MANCHVLDLQPLLELTLRIVNVSVFGKVDMFLLEGANKAFDVGILLGLADVRHTDLNLMAVQELDVGISGILHPLVRMKEERSALCQGSSQGR